MPQIDVSESVSFYPDGTITSESHLHVVRLKDAEIARLDAVVAYYMSLGWPSYSERGKIARRFKLPQTRLTDEQTFTIISDPRPQNLIAQEFGIDQSYVSRLKSGQATRVKNAPRCY